jgi:predicted metal-dependent hydrolase
MLQELATISRALDREVRTITARGRGMRLRVQDGAVILSLPGGKLSAEAISFVKREIPWLRKQLAKHDAGSHAGSDQCQIQLLPGDQIPLWGSPHALVYGASGALFSAQPQALHVLSKPGPKQLAHTRKIIANGLHNVCMEALMQDVKSVSQSLGVLPRKVSLKTMRTRWGSLGPENTMNINVALIFAPRSCLHYVVAHELAHVHERNHGPRFWRHVAHACPDYKAQHRLVQSLHAQLMRVSSLVFGV